MKKHAITRQSMHGSRSALVALALLASSSAWAGITSTWTGNGNVNNDGNWFDANNWNNGVPNAADDIAVLPAPTTRARTVTVNGNVAVQVLQMGYSGSNYHNILALGGNLTLGQISYSPTGNYNNYRVAVNGYNLTLGVGDLTSAQVPALSGVGLFVKTGTGTATLIYNPDTSFSGTYRVDSGILQGTYARISSSSTLLVNSGGAYHIAASGGEAPSITLNGAGYNNQGAFSTADNFTYGKSIALASDAAVSVNNARTLTLNGAFTGSGKLAKIGAGKLLIAGNSDGYTADTTIQAGTLEVTGLFRNSAITVKSGATLIAPSYRVGDGKVTVETGGTWNASAPPEWIKGDVVLGSDDGNWGDAANWGTGVVPTTLAILPTVTANGSSGNNIRTVTLAATGSVGTLNMLQGSGSFINRVLVNADFSIETLTMNPVTWGLYRIEVPADRTLEVGTAAGGFPHLYGTGTIRKTGSGDAKLIYSPGINWNGTYRADGGVTYLQYDRIYGVKYVVTDGGTLRVDNTTEQNNTSTMRIAGQGHLGTQGAIWCSGTVGSGGLAQPVTVTDDATVRVDATYTLGLKGALGGTGTLTLIGGGTLNLNANTWNVTVNGPTLNGIVVANGTLNIGTCNLAVTLTNSPTAGRHVLIDHSSAQGTLAGDTFASVAGLPETWRIVYADAAVNLVPPPGGTAILVR